MTRNATQISDAHAEAIADEMVKRCNRMTAGELAHRTAVGFCVYTVILMPAMWLLTGSPWTNCGGLLSGMFLYHGIALLERGFTTAANEQRAMKRALGRGLKVLASVEPTR